MSTDAPSSIGEPRNPWWVGHPIVRYPGLAALGLAAGSRIFLEGDAEVIGIGSGFLILGPVSVVTAILLLRGTIEPAAHEWARRVSPVTGVLAGLGFTVASVAMLIDVLVAPTERWGPVLIGAWCTAMLLAVSLCVEVVSRTESWPDRWRAPYQRAGAAATEPSATASLSTASSQDDVSASETSSPPSGPSPTTTSSSGDTSSGAADDRGAGAR
jgi:hypothetical protein